MTAAILACSTHLGESVAFGAPPILMVAGLTVFARRARRQADP